MFTAPIVHLFLVLFLCQWCQWCHGATTSPKTLDVRSSNFTKRPLNLYITANGKHVVLQNKFVDLIVCEEGKEEGCKMKTLQYIESVPPFAIKTRGSVLLIYDINSSEASEWHTYGRPSIVQMLAASGHNTVAVGLEHLWKQSTTVERLITQLNLTKIVLILPGHTDFDIPSIGESARLDAIVVIEPKTMPPVLKKTIVIKKEKSGGGEYPDDTNAQVVVVSNPMKEGHQEKVMQVVSNFLDFVHPR